MENVRREYKRAVRIVRHPDDFQKTCLQWRCQGYVTGLVPTMGYFHEGHLSLMRMAREQSEKVMVSLFVNPGQFGPDEDLSSYPVDFDRDAQLAEAQGVDILFAPKPEEMYGKDFSTWLEVQGVSKGLCGESRPRHFKGVATVVCKLFNLSLPSLAVFGEKDWQQLAVIRRMVKDLHFPVRIVGHPIVRESDGLAMSSRNAYLTETERKKAPAIYQGLLRTREKVDNGERTISVLKEFLRTYYTEHIPGARIDYVQFVDSESMVPLRNIGHGTLCAVAVRVGRARLIDNILIEV